MPRLTAESTPMVLQIASVHVRGGAVRGHLISTG